MKLYAELLPQFNTQGLLDKTLSRLGIRIHAVTKKLPILLVLHGCSIKRPNVYLLFSLEKLPSLHQTFTYI